MPNQTRIKSTNDKDLISYSKSLRKKMTPQEKKLWYQYLSKSSIKFYRQKIIKPYIVDFYSSKCSMVIELDGCQHYGEDGLTDYDKQRDKFLESMGLYFLHIPNNEIDNNFSNVCDKLDCIINARLV